MARVYVADKLPWLGRILWAPGRAKYLHAPRAADWCPQLASSVPSGRLLAAPWQTQAKPSWSEADRPAESRLFRRVSISCSPLGLRARAPKSAGQPAGQTASQTEQVNLIARTTLSRPIKYRLGPARKSTSTPRVRLAGLVPADLTSKPRVASNDKRASALLSPSLSLRASSQTCARIDASKCSRRLASTHLHTWNERVGPLSLSID